MMQALGGGIRSFHPFPTRQGVDYKNG